MELISFFTEELDRDETKKRVKKFFKRDFEKALNYSQFRRSDVTSPSFDPTGVSSHGTNNVENKFIRNTIADICVTRTILAINQCTNDTQIIIKNKFLLGLPDYVTYERMAIKDSQFYRLQTKALLEFAEVFDSLQEKYPLKIDKLAIYSDKKKGL